MARTHTRTRTLQSNAEALHTLQESGCYVFIIFFSLDKWAQTHRILSGTLYELKTINVPTLLRTVL